MTPRSPAHLRLVQRIVLTGLLLCMVLAQGFSLTHRTLHHDQHMHVHVHEKQQAEQHDAVHNDGAFSHLFASHEEGDETCRVIDGSTTYLEVFSLVAGILPALYAPVLVASIAHALAAWRAPLFEARGPPVHSL